ncbi:MAG: hypothetical protein JWR63_2881 [Conexibacter sp.]|nr:hypothetical protein [Conexibacter sp.]
MSDRCVARSNVSQLGDGLLRLKLTLPNSACGSATTATETGALVQSSTADGVSGHSGFSYNYGYVEWNAQVPAGTGGCGGPSTCIGATPQLWSMPDVHDFEIDTIEGYHGQACWNTHGTVTDPGTPAFDAPPAGCVPGAPMTTSFHTYGALWTPSGVAFYYDGLKVGDGRLGVHSTASEHFLVMDIINLTGLTMLASKELLVDSVRVWQPDADGDGVPDAPARNSAGDSDLCPTAPGPAWSHGCPPPSNADADGDGVTDMNDWCLNKVGVASNHGCPPEGQTSNAAVYRENVDGVNMFYPEAGGVLALAHMDSNLPNSWVHDTFPGTNAVGPPSAIHRSNGDVMSFYRGSDSMIHVTWLNHVTNGWADSTVGGPAIGPPSAVERNLNGDVHAFYRASDGHLHDAWLSGTTWHDQLVGGDAAGDPAVVDRPSNGQLHVFYRNVNGAIYDLWLSGSTWTDSYIGGAGDPAPMYRWDNGDIHVFYRATDGAMDDAVLSGGSWANWALGGTPAGKIAPIYRGPTGDLHAFYKSTDGYLHDMWMNAATNGWADATIAGPTAGTPSPVNRDKTNDLHVFYVRSNGDLYDAWLSGSSWHDQPIFGGAALPTS